MSSFNHPPFKAITDYAYNFSSTERIYAINTDLLFMSVLATSDVIDIPAADKAEMLQWLRQNQLTLKKHKGKRTTIPLTKGGDSLLKLARAYADDLQEQYIGPEHFVLAFLSAQSHIDNFLAKRGITYSTYMELLQQRKNISVDIPMRRMRQDMFRNKPYTAFELWLYPRGKKAALADKHMRDALTLFQCYDMAQCRAACELALQLDPGLIRAFTFTAAAWAYEKDYRKAVHYCQLAYKKDPANADLMNRIGFYYVKSGNNLLAEEWFKKSLALNPNSIWTLNNLAFTYLEMQRYQEALPYLDQVITADPAFSDAYDNKGYALMELGELAQARQLMTHAIELDKGNAYNYYNLARLHLKEDDIAGAISLLKKARRYDFAGRYGPEVDDLLLQLEGQ